MSLREEMTKNMAALESRMTKKIDENKVASDQRIQEMIQEMVQEMTQEMNDMRSFISDGFLKHIDEIEDGLTKAYEAAIEREAERFSKKIEEMKLLFEKRDTINQVGILNRITDVETSTGVTNQKLQDVSEVIAKNNSKLVWQTESLREEMDVNNKWDSHFEERLKQLEINMEAAETLENKMDVLFSASDKAAKTHADDVETAFSESDENVKALEKKIEEIELVSVGQDEISTVVRLVTKKHQEMKTEMKDLSTAISTAFNSRDTQWKASHEEWIAHFESKIGEMERFFRRNTTNNLRLLEEKITQLRGRLESKIVEMESRLMVLDLSRSAESVPNPSAAPAAGGGPTTFPFA
jgi:uncharacterized phage-like protein YoqJ